MPLPVSRTESVTDEPSSAARVSTSSSPPSGMASRELATRFMQDLLDLPGLGQDAQARRARRHRQVDVLADQAIEQLARRATGRVQLDRLGGGAPLPAEHQELAGQRRAALRRLEAAPHVARGFVVGRQRAQRHLGQPAEAHEQVVEVVRDPARQRPDGLEALRVPQLPLQLPLLGDVANDAGDPVLLAHRKAAVAHQALLAVGPQDAVLLV